MGYRELLPNPALRPYVDRFWLRTPGAAAPGAARILPDGCIDILIDVPEGGTRVVGAMTRAVVYGGNALASIAAVRFRPGGAQPFLRVPALELTDRVVSSADLGLRWLTERRVDPGQLLGVLEDLESKLLERLGAVRLEPRIQYSARRLLGEQAPSIEELARELGQSRQQLGRTFRQQVGLSPKELGRIARLQRAIDQLQRAPELSLARAALALGYFDQSHMARDFRALAGITPQAARRARGSIFPIRSLWLEPC